AITKSDLRNMKPEDFGFFSFGPRVDEGEGRNEMRSLIERAEKIVGSVDLVVLPEMALTASVHEEIRTEVVSERQKILISGITTTEKEFATNFFEVDIPRLSEGKGGFEPMQQRKHHRWKLDRSQILQYGLGGILDPNMQWWEHIALDERRLTFLAFNPWLTL